MIRRLSLTLLLAAASAGAQSGERRFNLDRFDAVELASPDAVRVVPGDAYSVTASGDPRAVAALAITVRGDTLHVDRTPGSHRDRGATVTVAMPAMRAAMLSGSGSIRASGIAGPAFTGRLGGSGSMVMTGMKVGRASFALGGSGSIVAEGAADAVAIDLGGSGRIDTGKLATPGVATDMGGSGAITATASCRFP
ncbi:GIN domain-containing protein [Sphingomonas sp.]|uniref:GIN domain-containing protein n=1 Tax=Sphingomonas sp. TaxID=28214 RepID=UPI0035B00DAF